jgi:hypothetical protein
MSGEAPPVFRAFRGFWDSPETAGFIRSRTVFSGNLSRRTGNPRRPDFGKDPFFTEPKVCVNRILKKVP